jgi:hypothetical protein
MKNWILIIVTCLLWNSETTTQANAQVVQNNENHGKNAARENINTSPGLNPTARYIQRTMKALEESTTENPAVVRVLFYGQSITAQPWTKILQDQLRARFPTAEFEFNNAAIGGYQSNLLIRTADHDLYPWYPDLLFFHVYGPMDKYEEIIRRVRERTTAEIVLWTSHLSAGEKPDELFRQLDARSLEILEVADKYHTLKIDLRSKWCEYLLKNDLAPDAMLTDSVHLNPTGCELYARFMGEELVRIPDTDGDPASSGTITIILLDDPAVTQSADGSLTLRFTGNRVIAVSDGTGLEGARAKLLLDGRPVESVKELWAISRPSKGPAGIWMPAINHVGFEKTPVLEDWTLTFLPDSTPDGTRIHFKLQGSVTGDDGEGWSNERFVSNSGRAVIEPQDWRVAWTLGYRKAVLPDDFTVTWSSYPLFCQGYEPKPAQGRTLLVQGCSNAQHTLTLEAKGGALGGGSFIVYRPPIFKESGSQGHRTRTRTQRKR